MVATLKASGVRRVYGIPDDSLNGFTDALRRDDAIFTVDVGTPCIWAPATCG
jgi:thiamine pyrophosphate-dependent acetolactate synthase large subunit-like protein